MDGMLPVSPSYLYSIKAQASLTWLKIICELIDNSFDANARNVGITWKTGDAFCFEDDGAGCDNLLRMITLGVRQSHDTNSVCFYGVGAKQAMVWMWGTTHIETLHASGAHELKIDWERVASGQDPFPTSQAPSRRVKPGTLITCYTDRHAPKPQGLMADLSTTYTPAIEAGRRIVVTMRGRIPEVVRKRQWPQCSELIEDDIEVAGRRVHVKMGMVADGVQNTYQRGFAFERDYRVILESAIGAGEYSTSRIAARITLGNEWRLATNKDDFNEFKDEIGDAIFDRCGDLLKRASEQAMTIEDQSFNVELAGELNTITKRGKEKRPNEGEATGTVEPKRSGRRRTMADVVDGDGDVTEKNQDGNGKAGSKKKTGYTADTYSDANSMTLGKYDRDANRIQLNIGNPYIKDLYGSRDKGQMMPILYVILAEADRQQQAKEEPLFAQYGDYLAQVGRS